MVGGGRGVIGEGKGTSGAVGEVGKEAGFWEIKGATQGGGSWARLVPYMEFGQDVHGVLG